LVRQRAVHKFGCHAAVQGGHRARLGSTVCPVVRQSHSGLRPHGNSAQASDRPADDPQGTRATIPTAALAEQFKANDLPRDLPRDQAREYGVSKGATWDAIRRELDLRAP
jgi:hypothetical protein